MKLKESILAAGPKSVRRCAIAEILKRLSKAEAAELVACLDDDEIGHAQIARGLAAEGIRVSEGRVGHHRRRDCCCVDR